jgi:hypothetical protein
VIEFNKLITQVGNTTNCLWWMVIGSNFDESIELRFVLSSISLIPDSRAVIFFFLFHIVWQWEEIRTG